MFPNKMKKSYFILISSILIFIIIIPHQIHGQRPLSNGLLINGTTGINGSILSPSSSLSFPYPSSSSSAGSSSSSSSSFNFIKASMRQDSASSQQSSSSSSSSSGGQSPSSSKPFNVLKNKLFNQKAYGKRFETIDEFNHDDPNVRFDDIPGGGGGSGGYDPLTRLKMQNYQYSQLYDNIQTPDTEVDDKLGVKCTFEIKCEWTWDPEFQIVTGTNLTAINGSNITNHIVPGPSTDNKKDENGHFLHIVIRPNTTQKILKSPEFGPTLPQCSLEMSLHQSYMQHSQLRVITEPKMHPNLTSVLAQINGNNSNKWQTINFDIGSVSQNFRIIFEIIPAVPPSSSSSSSSSSRANKKNAAAMVAHLSIDNIIMMNCFPIARIGNDKCKFKCTHGKEKDSCISHKQICDIDVNCNTKEDELKNCDKIPYGGRCDFEMDWCGWHNSGKAIMLWTRHSGSTPTDKTGPNHDHTFKHRSAAYNGHYMFVNMNQHANDSEKRGFVSFASNAIMNSVIFNPPPPVHSNSSSEYANTCMVRFYVHHFGPNLGSLNLSVVEIKEKENITTTLWWSDRKAVDSWIRFDLFMPYITSRYYLQFEARMGMRIYSDAAIDDFSLTPECFGLNIPDDVLQGYNYYDPRLLSHRQTHTDFKNQSVVSVTTCGAKGKIGPTMEQFNSTYNNTGNLTAIRLIDSGPMKGIQIWKVPKDGYYTIIAKGAGGGLGSGGVGSSRGSLVRAVHELHRGEEIYIVVGQRGEHACIKSMGGVRDGTGCNGTAMDKRLSNISEIGFNLKTQVIKHFNIDDGAGGGGGASFIFKKFPDGNGDGADGGIAWQPLMVAGGGGGLGIGRYFEIDDLQHGKGFDDVERLDVSGEMSGEINKTGGSGGGWKNRKHIHLQMQMGRSIVFVNGGNNNNNINNNNGDDKIGSNDNTNSTGNGGGGGGGDPFEVKVAAGGDSCYVTGGIHGQGGFGGGGGGCRTGGGGGGYAGGDTSTIITNGNGGTSFIAKGRSTLSIVYAGENSDDGIVVIIPALNEPACGCTYKCVALDEFRATVACICPTGSKLRKNSFTECEKAPSGLENNVYLVIFGFSLVCVLLATALGSLVMMLYNRYLQNKQHNDRQKIIYEQDLQLSRLRMNRSTANLANFNPNYGADFFNPRMDTKALPLVARESLTLLTALGQGAFGEVFHGMYRHRDNDSVEMPVAVKTLPALSTGQDEEDFLMEAAIMAKFNHPNIVHLIGVCFDRHPRYIVLELLAGGDLKNFLREGRNRLDKPSALTLKDLLFCAIDVAKGCRYMESKRFIHRDIASRNCLLSSRGPGRVVKIADFGMARDIYRSEYYRKGGKAMLPIKWMPPESFMDGLFSSKTDVWSFGVTVWEIFSLGINPYTGISNRQVMRLVTLGGRLEPPNECPLEIIRLMENCWNPDQEQRPSFATILEILNTCMQDPAIYEAPLPSILRPILQEAELSLLRRPRNGQPPVAVAAGAGGAAVAAAVAAEQDYLEPLPEGHHRIMDEDDDDNDEEMDEILASFVTFPAYSHSAFSANTVGQDNTFVLAPERNNNGQQPAAQLPAVDDNNNNNNYNNQNHIHNHNNNINANNANIDHNSDDDLPLASLSPFGPAPMAIPPPPAVNVGHQSQRLSNARPGDDVIRIDISNNTAMELLPTDTPRSLVESFFANRDNPFSIGYNNASSSSSSNPANAASAATSFISPPNDTSTNTSAPTTTPVINFLEINHDNTNAINSKISNDNSSKGKESNNSNNRKSPQNNVAMETELPLNPSNLFTTNQRSPPAGASSSSSSSSSPAAATTSTAAPTSRLSAIEQKNMVGSSKQNDYHGV